MNEPCNVVVPDPKNPGEYIVLVCIYEPFVFNKDLHEIEEYNIEKGPFYHLKTHEPYYVTTQHYAVICKCCGCPLAEDISWPIEQ
jgi:hypothetical protein